MADNSAPPVELMASAKVLNEDKAADSTSLKWDRFSHRVRIHDILSREDGGVGCVGEKIRVGGWVKTGREQGKGSFAFLELNDGSCLANLQAIVLASVYHPLGQLVATGTCVYVEGELTKPPQGTKQNVELRVHKVLEIGTVVSAEYPLPKTMLTSEYTRDYLHLRLRTTTMSAVARIRNALSSATHKFFQDHGFLKVETPIITTIDCEGAGETFQVTTMISDAEKVEKELKQNPLPSEYDIEAAKFIVEEKEEAVKQLKLAKTDKEDIIAAVAELNKANGNMEKLEERSKLNPGLPQKDGKLDYSKDFFGCPTFLAVSGQLQLESSACALSSVYTFGPTFRAEQSHTSRHLAEFLMVEQEMAFADLEDDMNCAEEYVQFLCKWLVDKCRDDMEFIDKTAIDRLKLVYSSPFVRISYTEAVELLEKVTEKKFENKVEWGIDLASEHERYLTEVIYKKPVIVYNYPKGIKAFYMRLNDDNKTVAAMDVLVPKVGELIGGSQREERYDVLKRRILEAGLSPERYDWYLSLRRYGTVKHSGFGLGFERMVLFATGIDNIKDVIPFPRYPGRADL